MLRYRWEIKVAVFRLDSLCVSRRMLLLHLILGSILLLLQRLIEVERVISGAVFTVFAHIILRLRIVHLILGLDAIDLGDDVAGEALDKSELIFPRRLADLYKLTVTFQV